MQFYVQLSCFINPHHTVCRFFFPFSINFYYFSPSVTFDARNWFLCSFAVQQGQNNVPGKPEEQPANNVVIKAQHNLKCPARTPGCDELCPVLSARGRAG